MSRSPLTDPRPGDVVRLNPTGNHRVVEWCRFHALPGGACLCVGFEDRMVISYSDYVERAEVLYVAQD